MNAEITGEIPHIDSGQAPRALSRLLAARTLSPAAPHCRIGLVAWGSGARRRRRGPEGLKGHLDAVTRRLADLILGPVMAQRRSP